jgi:hypothetical protein
MSAQAHSAHITRPRTGTRYLNAVLTAIACLLALNLLAGRGALPASSPASAQEYKPSDLPFNSGDQRNRVTAAMESVDARLAQIEARLDKGLSVKVTEMPPMRMADDKKDDRRDDKRADKPAPKVEVRGGPAANPPAGAPGGGPATGPGTGPASSPGQPGERPK